MVGGFMGVGTPERVMDELAAPGQARPDRDRQRHRDAGRAASASWSPPGAVRKAIVSHIGLNPETQQKMLAGEMEVELVPQGTLIERIRAAGYGLGGILTPTGVGTVVEEGKRKIEVDGARLPARNAACTPTSRWSRRSSPITSATWPTL